MDRFSRMALALLLMGGGLALAACEPAETIKVTTTIDVVADDGVTSLREAFAEANLAEGDDGIDLVAGATYDLTDCAAGALVHTTASVLVLAADPADRATIHQTCPDAGIIRSTPTGSSLVVIGTRLVGGPGSGATVPGAGLNVSGALMLVDSTVTGVDAGPGGTVVEIGMGGPAAADLRLHDSTITGNTGTGVRVRDGGVRLDGVVEVSDNVGDGIRLDGSSALLSDGASVDGNVGWGVHVDGVGNTPVDMYNGSISGNGAGGFFCSGCDASLSTFDVDRNGADAAAGSGGGIVFLVDQQGPGVQTRLGLGPVRIRENRALRSGGGVFVGRAETSDPGASTATHIGSSTVEGNVTVGDDRPGGGVAVTVGTLTLTNDEISSNVAAGTGSDGGGVFLAPGDPGPEPSDDYNSYFSTTFTGNRSGGRGGGAYVDATRGVALDDVAFDANLADGRGGGLYARGELLTVPYYGNRFTGNTAGAQGGGAYLEATGVLFRSSFDGNRANEGGGVFFGPTSDVTIMSSTFASNTASVQGGGITFAGARLDLQNSTLSGNSAPRGGGLSVGAGPASVAVGLTTFTGNSAPVGANVAGSGGRVEIATSLLVAPLGGGGNCAVDPPGPSPQGYSFVSDTSCGSHPTDVISAADPQLGPLADNGGPTRTHLPAPTSPIVGLVPDPCPYVHDQRDEVRPLGPACEPGSVEILGSG